MSEAVDSAKQQSSEWGASLKSQSWGMEAEEQRVQGQTLSSRPAYQDRWDQPISPPVKTKKPH